MISETQKEKGTDIKPRGNSYSCREEQKFETQSCVLQLGVRVLEPGRLGSYPTFITQDRC